MEVLQNVFEIIVGQFQAAFLNIPQENALSWLYIIVNFVLQIGSGLGGN